MAVNVKKTKKTTTSAASLLSSFQTTYGDSIGNFGGNLVDTDRVPTGMFPLDLSLGGGFPRGKCSIIFGPESSGKTNLALLAIANHQLLWPDKTNVFFDVEGSYDPAWAKILGVDTEKVIVIRPSYAEQLVDMVESILQTEDCGIVVIDSLAALVTTQEIDSSAEKANVGGAGLVTGKLVRKTTLALNEAEKNGYKPTLIYINQTRMKIGVMYGNPETQPGGNAPQFQACIRLRVYGKNEMDSKVSTVMPIKKVTTFAISKWKCPILAASGKFEMVTMAHNGMVPGFCDDFNTVAAYLKEFGMFEKADKKGWAILGEVYPTQAEFKAKLYADKKFGTEVRQGIITRLLEDGQTLNVEDADDE